jgi:hypothetical protein
MTKYKTSIHCGQVSTFLVDEFESKQDAKDHYEKLIVAAANTSPFFNIGDVLIKIDYIRSSRRAH